MQPSAPQLPPFQILADAAGLFTPAEMDALIAAQSSNVAEGKLGAGGRNTQVRRSQTAFLPPDETHRWLYDRVWAGAVELNRRFFCVDIDGVRDHIQIARYDAAEQGFYDWHLDFGDIAPTRKISITVQLSDPADYDGGDLELRFRGQPYRANRTRGQIVAFPSWALHRVTPVTRGVRWSLVAWISGPRWR